MKRQLLLYPDPHLREKTHTVRLFNGEIISLAEDMRRIMHENNGMGLAANQVGDNRRIVIVEYPISSETGESAIPFTILVNPTITNASNGTSTMPEGCLSVPSVEIPINRPEEVTVLAQNPNGKQVKIRAKGMYARILQHEIDHLNGKLILDYARPSSDNLPSVVVWGSTDFTTVLLNSLLANAKVNIKAIVTEAPKPSGRGKGLTPTIVHHYAEARSIPCLEPTDLQDTRFHSYLASLEADIFLVAAYGRLLPKEILSIPKRGCLNIHPSLLPRYRGASPIQYAILNGDDKTGVSLMVMDPEFDTGDLLAQSEVILDSTETFDDLSFILAELGGEMVQTVLPLYIEGRIEPIPQNDSFASQAPKITRTLRWLNPTDPPKVNERKVRAFARNPSAFVMIDGQPLKVVQSHLEDGKLFYDRVIPAGKKEMAWDEFKRGFRKDIVYDTNLTD